MPGRTRCQLYHASSSRAVGRELAGRRAVAPAVNRLRRSLALPRDIPLFTNWQDKPTERAPWNRPRAFPGIGRSLALPRDIPLFTKLAGQAHGEGAMEQATRSPWHRTEPRPTVRYSAIHQLAGQAHGEDAMEQATRFSLASDAASSYCDAGGILFYPRKNRCYFRNGTLGWRPCVSLLNSDRR